MNAHVAEMSTDQDLIGLQFFFHNWSTGLDRTEKIYVVLM